MDFEDKEKDEVEEIFSKALERQDQQNILDEEEQEEVEADTHNTEIIAPIIAYIFAIASIIDKFWYASYFGFIFVGVGLFSCKLKKSFLKKWVLLMNVFALAACFFMSGFWIILYVFTKL
ncbi:MAG: hypothetical protein J6Y28_03915 [Acholeplasmatales bacterium]|nr:hypothetical protein [Acholeplasmatales bacterium]